MKYFPIVLVLMFLFPACSEDSPTSVCGDCDDGIDCTIDTCNEDTEFCEHEPDNSRCAQGEICDPQDGCKAGDVCTGDANCDDRQYCNGKEKCVDGVCQPGTPVDCTDTVDCTDDICDEDMNVCVNLPYDGNCAPDERCDRILGCVSTVCQTDIDCDDSNICTTDTCVDSTCQYENNPGSCDDGLWCTENDECVDGKCTGTLRDCGSAGAECKRMTCDEETQECIEEDIQPGESCDDGLYCTINDVCDDNALCAGTLRDCSEADSQCAEGVCDDDEDACVGSPINEDQPCDDNDPCTEGDVCWDGQCYGDSKDCDDDNPCTDDSCDPANGNCVNTPRADCDPTGDPCTQNDTCMGGLCLNPIDGFEGGYCSEDCSDDGQCVGTDTACAEYQGDMWCFVTCELGQGDTCTRAGYRCAPVGTGSQGVCWPGEDNCTDGQDNDSDSLYDCNDPDCATDPACIIECTAVTGTVTCPSQKDEDTSGEPNVYEFYGACDSHRYTGPEHIYSLTPSADLNLIASLDTAGNFDGALIVLSENCWPELACSALDEQSGLTPESVQVPMIAGETYYIIVDGYSGSSMGEYTLSVSCGEPEDCSDSVDNDEDGKTDCYDPDCAGDAACLAAEVACDDDLDNDDDSDTDCDDWDCRNDPACQGESNCRDKIDNDNDDLTDCEDDDCENDSWCDAETICDDQYDNDNDMETDCWDPDCFADAYCQAETDCRDGIDNDADWDTDCEDTDCANDDWCLPESNCTDNIDNDNDSLTDCDDDDCEGDPGCVEHCVTTEVITCDQTRNNTTVGEPNNVNDYWCDEGVTYDGPEFVYEFTATESGPIRFQVTAAGWDSALFVMEDECTPSLECYDNHDAPLGSPEWVDVDAVAGTTYYAIIDSAFTTEGGPFNFNMICVTETEENCSDGMDNDLDDLPDCADDDCELSTDCNTFCTHHETIGCGDNEFDNTGSSNTITTYNCATEEYFTGGERIYRFTPNSDTSVEFTLRGSLGDYALFALQGTCTPNTTCIDWADEDAWISFQEEEVVDFNATAGTDYYIIVDTAAGSFDLLYWLSVSCQ